MNVDTRARAGTWPVVVTFLLFGALSGSWAGRIPWVRDNLDLSAGQLGIALLAPALGAVLSMPFAGLVTARLGTRPALTSSLAATAVATVLPPLAPNLFVLFLVLMFWGASTGFLDVSVNSAAVQAEQRSGRSIMSGMHGMWSLGALVGAAVAGLVASAGIGAPVNLAVAGAAVAVLGIPAALKVVPHAGARPDGPTFALPSRPVVVLGLIGFCALFAEGAVADWSAVFLVDVRHTTEGVAASGYAVFSICMVVGRLAGNWLVDRFGPVRVVGVATAAGTVGLLLALTVPSLVTAWIGFGLTGLGLAVVVPLTFGAAGHRGAQPSTSIAAVATMSYVGWLSGPTVIGGLASITSLPVALGVNVALVALIGVLAGALAPPADSVRDSSA